VDRCLVRRAAPFLDLSARRSERETNVRRRNCPGFGGSLWRWLIAAGSLFIATHSQHALASPEMSKPKGVIGAVEADWNKDGVADRAALVKSESESDQADLLIYLSTPSGDLDIAMTKKNIAWRGARAGTEPSLSLSLEDSLRIIAENTAIGRDTTIFVKYREGRFVVIGYSFTSRDPKAGWCSVNLLVGSGAKMPPGQNGIPFQIPARPVELTAWSQDAVPQACR
jgi:hypothetical protein